MGRFGTVGRRPDAPTSESDRNTALETHDYWSLVSRFGAAGVLLPAFAVAVGALWSARQHAALRVWLPTLALAVVVTLASKLLFFGWGIGSAWLDFTGVSGHAVLAASILPVFFQGLLLGAARRARVAGVVLGISLAAAVGVSRVALSAHSWSEVIAAWLLGGAVSALTLQAMRPGSGRAHWPVRAAPLLLLLALAPGGGTYLPTHAWEVDLSLWLSGRARPYTREQLRSAARVRPAAVTACPAASAPGATA